MPNEVFKPRLVFWEVTKGCNLRCVHCRATATELSSPSDLPTDTALRVIEQIASFASPILVLSGGEPLFRADIFQLARYGTDRGLRVALATNGTLVTQPVAQKIVDSGVRRVSMSLDGADAETHDLFRGIPGAFDATLRGFRNLKDLGMSMQINMTVTRHNAHQLPALFDLARSIGADALHTFLLVPVGCGVDIAEEQMVAPDEYERILNWFYDRSLTGEIELKATCAPHYFRVAKQRQVEAKKATASTCAPQAEFQDRKAIGPTDMLMPSGTGIALHPHARRGGANGGGHGHPESMNAMTKGCLAGTGVCFLSHEGEIFPCGYLPVKAGDLRQQTFAEVWTNSQVFEELRDTSNLQGKCGCCEFRNICMGCRARAFAASGDMMAEEPFCIYQPKTLERSKQPAGKK
jgi:radical SAM protein with 4Fe4S-binding SPASM domain